MLIKESFAEYRLKAQQNLSSHALADFRKSPRLYQMKKSGLIEDEDRPAYVIGRAAHTMILEGRSKYDAEYIIGGPINEKTGKPFGIATKAFAEWQAMQTKEVISFEQDELIRTMADSVMSHKLIFQAIQVGTAEAVIRETMCGIPCQSRLDFFNETHGTVDLKTCDDLSFFEVDARRYGYIYQLAFYREMMKIESGHEHPVHLIGVEKKPPYRCGIWKISNDSLDVAASENKEAINRLKKCIGANDWPTGYEDLRVFSL